LVRVLLVFTRDADELLQVLDAALRLDRPLRLERLEIAAALERSFDELRYGKLERARLQRLDQRPELLHCAERRRPHPRLLGELRRLPERPSLCVCQRLLASQAGLDDTADESDSYDAMFTDIARG